jgi:proliferating cell nuclear antigen
MFQCVISQPALKGIIDAVKAIVDEDIKLIIDENGFKIEAVDASNVGMVFLNAKAAAFDVYKADKMELALSLLTLEKFSDIKDLPVSIQLDEESHKLKISQGKTKYSMSLIDPEVVKKGPKIPQLDMPCSVVMAGIDLQEAVRAANKVSDHVIFEQGEELFTISAKGDIDSAKVEFLLSELMGVKHGVGRALFAIDYITDMSKVIAKNGSVVIDCGVDYPARLSFTIGDNISVQYLLAPRIEQE